MKAKINLISLIILFSSLNPVVFAWAKPMDIYAANQLLARTINIGFTFDAPKEGAWGNMITQEEIKNIKSAGFTAIRLPIQWITRMDTVAPYTIDKSFLERIDWVIKQTLKNHLAIIIENCLDEQLMAQPEKYKNRFMSLWQQLSDHYTSRPQQVMFEIMAEPHGKLDKEVWENYFNEALTIIRVHNPSRPVIIGSGFFNTPYNIKMLHLPENDRFIIVTFHMYEPVKFTMQGEAWFPYGKPMEWIGTKWTGTPAEQRAITYNMDVVSKWATDNKRPVFMGEFGASDHADMESKAKLFTFYREQAEQRHFSWGVWSYTVNFSIYDNKKDQWNAPLLKALIPSS